MARKNEYAELITWGDAYSQDEWVDPKEAGTEDHILAQSLGFVVRETSKSVTLCLNRFATNDSISCIMTIPKGMIVKRQKIKLPIKK